MKKKNEMIKRVIRQDIYFTLSDLYCDIVDALFLNQKSFDIWNLDIEIAKDMDLL